MIMVKGGKNVSRGAPGRRRITAMPDFGGENPLRVERTSQTLVQLTAEILREAIVKRHFKPNQRLVERELCEQTGVSRTCVREALRHLESEGLVQRMPNRGLYVASLSADEARQLYEVRAAIEAKAGYHFALRASEAEVDDLRAALRAFERSASTKGVAAYVEALNQFYGVLLRGSRNEVAAQILRTLWARINYLRAMTAEKEDDARRNETVRLLREIAELAAARDCNEVALKCEAFVDRSAAFAIALLRDLEESKDDTD